jgi:hypothetical protein
MKKVPDTFFPTPFSKAGKYQRSNKMQLCKLGDALDGWKGWLLERMRAALRPLYVVPMVTDDEPWPDGCIPLYAHILGVPEGHIVMARKQFTHGGRKVYFDLAAAAIPQCGDAFVDANTGPWTGNAKNNVTNHIKSQELGRLLLTGFDPPQVSDRIALVYCHKNRGQHIAGLTADVQRWARETGGCWGLGLDCGVTAMLAFSHSQSRLADLRSLVARKFGPVADARVTNVVQ